MALIKEPEKEETDQLTFRMRVANVRRYRTLVERGKKLHVNIPASHEAGFEAWMTEAEAELNAMTVTKLRTPKVEAEE
jgi:hypothetical protein